MFFTPLHPPLPRLRCTQKSVDARLYPKTPPLTPPMSKVYPFLPPVAGGLRGVRGGELDFWLNPIFRAGNPFWIKMCVHRR